MAKKERGRPSKVPVPIHDWTTGESSIRPLNRRLCDDLNVIHRELSVPIRQIALIVRMSPTKLNRFINRKITNLTLDEATDLELFLAKYVDPQTGIAFRNPLTGYRLKPQARPRPQPGLPGGVGN